MRVFWPSSNDVFHPRRYDQYSQPCKPWLKTMLVWFDVCRFVRSAWRGFSISLSLVQGPSPAYWTRQTIEYSCDRLEQYREHQLWSGPYLAETAWKAITRHLLCWQSQSDGTILDQHDQIHEAYQVSPGLSPINIRSTGGYWTSGFLLFNE